ncbi:MAG: SecD/SecF fusion protein, partial [Thermoleophilaceae bacterium]|nr:SecD/SecF fusion protein [Thermoleophilaceae bacterium]
GVLSPLGLGDAKIQRVSGSGVGANTFQITTHALSPTQLPRVKDALNGRFTFTKESDQTVGPTFGSTVANSAIIAIIASLLVISGYIALRFEWKYAVPVLIALMHDILITAGVYSLLGREVTTSTVAALLTILGYSLYDTIIVFDRVRENVPRMPRAAFSQIVNRSMSEVITRSLVTSLSTLLPILALMLFGGETLRDFGFALLIGVASGTYSSIFIAAPVLTHWKERETVWRRREKIVLEDHGGFVPAYADASLGDEAAPAAARRRVGRKKAAPAAVEPVVTESAVAVEEPPEPEPKPAPAPRPVGSRPSTPEARRAARRAARAAELGKPDGDGAPKPASDDDEAAAAAAKRAAANRRRKKHGRSR